MKIYKLAEFALMLNVSSETLRRWDRSGKLKAFRTPSNHRFYTHEQYEQYMRGNK
ncbi:resolvase domain-containing protein [Bacillus phage PBC1]|uniref:Resolvase domain-containing protein n=1 Tax=Bacillus phage PBC1 TaxID=1161901 RepID=I1TLI1_9CAUD|nr:transposase [Bacillus phage PBC1]AFE86283.1 resolvase domain-containing protein [Bacillus phage PBC1]